MSLEDVLHTLNEDLNTVNGVTLTLSERMRTDNFSVPHKNGVTVPLEFSKYDAELHGEDVVYCDRIFLLSRVLIRLSDDYWIKVHDPVSLDRADPYAVPDIFVIDEEDISRIETVYQLESFTSLAECRKAIAFFEAFPKGSYSAAVEAWASR